MKQKDKIKKLLNEAYEMLSRQVLPSEELKARAMLKMAINIVLDAEDEEAPKSGAV
jgi:hypothetical protein